MTNTIYVSGTGEVSAEPETADVVLAITVEASNAADIRESLSGRHSDVTEALVEEGFDEEDIVTENYGIRTQRRGEEQDIPRYQGTHTLRVDAGAVDAAGTVIDVAVEAGATDVQQVVFQLSDKTRRACRDEAIELAVDEARRDAETAVKAAADIDELGGVSEMSVDRATVSPTQQRGEAMALSAERGTDTSIETDDVGVKASVSVTYELI